MAVAAPGQANAASASVRLISKPAHTGRVAGATLVGEGDGGVSTSAPRAGAAATINVARINAPPRMGAMLDECRGRVKRRCSSSGTLS